MDDNELFLPPIDDDEDGEVEFVDPAEYQEDNDEEKEQDENDDEELDELSGCDPDEPYFPFPSLPEFVSKRYQRLSAFQNWFHTRPDGTLQMPDQTDDDETSPLVLPVVAKFTQKCIRQTASELGNDVYVIILGFEEDRPITGNFYVVFYDGARVLEHIANVGDDDEIYPYPSLSAAGRILYGSNCNGWKAFEVCDVNNPHHGKTLASIRPSEGGPGFVNSFDPILLAKWDNLPKRQCAQQSIQYLTKFAQAFEALQNQAGDESSSEPSEEAAECSEREEEEEDSEIQPESSEDEVPKKNQFLHPSTVIKRAKLPPPTNAVIIPEFTQFKKRLREVPDEKVGGEKSARLDSN